jgi:hypothetical protein
MASSGCGDLAKRDADAYTLEVTHEAARLAAAYCSQSLRGHRSSVPARDLIVCTSESLKPHPKTVGKPFLAGRNHGVHFLQRKRFVRRERLRERYGAQRLLNRRRVGQVLAPNQHERDFVALVELAFGLVQSASRLVKILERRYDGLPVHAFGNIANNNQRDRGREGGLLTKIKRFGPGSDRTVL